MMKDDSHHCMMMSSSFFSIRGIHTGQTRHVWLKDTFSPIFSWV